MLDVRAIETHLKNDILPFWMALKDEKHGGYVGYVGFDLVRQPEASKGCILNSRILWFFSNAAMTLGDDKYIPYADHAYEMLCRMTDEKNGGVYWSLNVDGSVDDGTKHTYNQAFAIYALASYYKLTGKAEVLERAKQLFGVIETKCRDEGGYLEAFTHDWQPESNEKLSENGVMATRTMNTLLHVMEGYTGLYTVWQDETLKARLYEILDIFENKMYNHELNRQEVFFDHEYNTLIDLHSYGHDIETSWLTYKTLDALNDKELTARIEPLLLAMAEKTYETALTDKGFLNECERGVNNTNRMWWIQAEALVGFLNAFEKTGKDKYLLAAESQWNYIRDYLIDRRGTGEWYWQIRENGQPDETQPEVSCWKCPYHNGRMAFEVIERSRKA